MQKIIYALIITSLFITSCSKLDKKENIDLSKIELDLNIKRLDLELFNINPNTIQDTILYLLNKYDSFFELYTTNIIQIGYPGNRIFSDYLTHFVTDYTMNLIYEKTKEEFSDVSAIEKGLENAFKRYHWYFPDQQIPALYMFNGGFNQSIVVADSILAIGTDKYLGRDCEFYDKLGLPEYIQTNMYKEKILSDCMHSWAITEFVFNDSLNYLVNNIVYQGKLQYFLDQILPDHPDTLKFGFTYQELDWCQNNEQQMWDFLIDKKLLFSTDQITINKFINPSPFTSGFPHASPGRATIWLGREIVRTYMKRNPDVSLYDLMIDNDHQKILRESRYEP